MPRSGVFWWWWESGETMKILTRRVLVQVLVWSCARVRVCVGVAGWVREWVCGGDWGGGQVAGWLGGWVGGFGGWLSGGGYWRVGEVSGGGGGWGVFVLDLEKNGPRVIANQSLEESGTLHPSSAWASCTSQAQDQSQILMVYIFMHKWGNCDLISHITIMCSVGGDSELSLAQETNIEK